MYGYQNYDLKLANQRGVDYFNILTDSYTPTAEAVFNGFGNPYGSVIVNGFLYVAIADESPSNVKKIDVTNGCVVASIQVENDPRGLCFDGRYIWCANYDLNGPGNTVSKIDSKTDAVVSTITVGGQAGFIESDGLGYVWVACLDSTSAYIIKTDDDSVQTVNLGVKPKGLAFDNRGYMYFTTVEASKVVKVRTTSKWIDNVSTATGTYGACSAGRFIYATGFNNKLYRINRISLGVNTFTLPATPTRRPAYDGKRVWIPCGDSGKTVIFDTDQLILDAVFDNSMGSNKHVCFDEDYAYISVDDAILKVKLI